MLLFYLILFHFFFSSWDHRTLPCILDVRLRILIHVATEGWTYLCTVYLNVNGMMVYFTHRVVRTGMFQTHIRFEGPKVRGCACDSQLHCLSACLSKACVYVTLRYVVCLFEICLSVSLMVVVELVVAFSLHARIMAKGSTNHSRPMLFSSCVCVCVCVCV